MNKKAAFLIALTCVFASGTARCEDTRLDLPVSRAVAMALSRNLDLRVEQLNAAMNEAELAKSRGIYDPELTASGSVERSMFAFGDAFNRRTASAAISQLIPTGGTIRVEGSVGNSTSIAPNTPGGVPPRFTSRESSYLITLTQPILNGAGRDMTEFTITLAAYLLDDSLERFRFLAADTASSAMSAYNRLYALRQQLESKRLSLDAARLVLEETRAQVAAGTLANMEITSAEFGVVQRQKDLIDAERSVSDQAGVLRVLTGIEDDKRDIIPTDPPAREEVDLTEKEALAKALDLRGDMKQLHNQLKLSELQERFARNLALPRVDALGTFGTSTFTDRTFDAQGNVIFADFGDRSWSASLNLTYPLGNTAAENEYRRARLRTEQVRQQIAALSRRIRNEVETDFRALISARLQIRAADKSREYAEQRLVDYREKKARGAATAKEVLDVENDLANARVSQVEAAQTYADAVTKLRRDTGLLLDHLGIKIDTSKSENLMKERG